MTNHPFSILIMLICILLSAYFSATETAFSSLNRIRVKSIAEKGNRKAALVLKLSADYDRLLSTILVGNNIVNIASASLATMIFVRLLGEEAGAGVSTAVTTVVVLIFGEVSPKSIAKESPEKFAMFSAPFLSLLVWLLTPVNYFFVQWKKLLSRLFKTSDSASVTEEELLAIVEEARQDGGIDDQEGALIRSAIEFADLQVEDVFTPRIDVVGVSEIASKEEIASVFASTGYSRLPVYRDTLDQIVGIIYQKDFHNFVFRTKEPLSSVMKPALFVPKSKKVGTLLRELQQDKSHIAVVLDEFAGTVGIVTLEDLLEELVGEIWDEHDEVREEIRSISENEYLVLGSANIEKLFEELHMEERDFDVVTVSGWIMEELGKVPEEKDSFDYKGIRVTVEEMTDRRVKLVHIQKILSIR